MAVLRFLNNTSLFVSLGALFTYAYGVLIMREQIIVTHALNTFFLTWCAYQFIKPIDSQFRKVFMVLACTGACINGLFLPLHFLIPLVIGFVLTLLYKNDWRGEDSGRMYFSLRSKGWTKTLATAGAWTIVTSWWMFAELVSRVDGWIMAIPVCAQFLWIGALALAGDLRDISVESDENQTLPAKWGSLKTRIICTAMITFSGILEWVILIGQGHFKTSYALLFGTFFSVVLLVIWKVDSRKNWHHLTIILDGLLILKGIGAFLYILC